MTAHQEKDVGIIGCAIKFQPSRAPGFRVELGSAVLPTGLIVAIVRWDAVVIVLGVHDPGKAHLSEIVEAIDALGFGLGLIEGRQQHRCEDGDDRDYYQQFNQSKTDMRTQARWLLPGAHNARLPCTKPKSSGTAARQI